MRKLVAVVLFALLLPCLSLADEGMWMPHQISGIDQSMLRSMGLTLSPDEIYSESGDCLAKAVIRLGGGTATFVSDRGLIITNHHVAFAAIHSSSSVQSNLMRDGFVAKTTSEEIPAKGYDAYVLKGYRDVTDKITTGISDKTTAKQRFEIIEKNTKQVLAEAESSGDIRAEVVSAFAGLKYYLFTYLHLIDIRTVYVPPGAVGNYGGEVDNWMWPRHTGDFAFMRAYVGPDGNPAPYSKDNVPYKPEKYLPLSSEGVKTGDLVMIMGYPYRTERYLSAVEAEDTVVYQIPTKLHYLHSMYKIMHQESSKDEKAALVLAGSIVRIQNYMKKYEGVGEGLARGRYLDHIRNREQRIADSLNDPERTSFLDAAAAIERFYDRHYNSYKRKALILDWMTYFVQGLQGAVTINKWSLEKTKDDLSREPEYMDRNIPELKKRLEAIQYRMHAPTDRMVLGYFIGEALALPKGQRIRFIDKQLATKPGAPIDKEQIDQFVTALYADSKITENDQRLAMFGEDRKTLLARNDSLIAFADGLEEELEEIRTLEKTFDGAKAKLRPAYLRGVIAAGNGNAYPDANYTMRWSYGAVKGYQPRDAVEYLPQTTGSGLLEKNTGHEPFNLPQPVLDALQSRDFGRYYDKNLNDLPICYLTTNDATGGNSGSASINGKGEITGLIFDTTYESVSSDYMYSDATSRAIHVDIRYVLFVLDRVYHIDNVLEELDISGN